MYTNLTAILCAMIQLFNCTIYKTVFIYTVIYCSLMHISVHNLILILHCNAVLKDRKNTKAERHRLCTSKSAAEHNFMDVKEVV